MSDEVKTIEHHGTHAIRWWFHPNGVVINFEVMGWNGATYEDDRLQDAPDPYPEEWPEGGHEWEGFVKWDGCVNIIPRDKGCMVHYCDGLRDLAEMCKALDEIAKREFIRKGGYHSWGDIQSWSAEVGE